MDRHRLSRRLPGVDEMFAEPKCFLIETRQFIQQTLGLVRLAVVVNVDSRGPRPIVFAIDVDQPR